MICLTDDGSLDTVFGCTGCMKTFRYNYAMSFDGVDDEEVPTYDQWLNTVIRGLEKHHDCNDSENDFL